MPTSGGPNMSGEENLVFGFDLSDTLNSYVGEPTENLTIDTPSQSGWQGTYSVVDSSTKTFLITTQQNTASIGSAWRTFYWSVSSYIGSYITISADVEFISQTNCTFRDITIGQGNTGQYPTHITGSDALDKVVNSNKPVDKTRMTWSGVINATGLVGFTYWINNVTVDGANSVLKISNVQIESKPHDTPFVNGTRSATEGLVDLTGNNTIDLTNVSFNNDAQMVFDGTDDYMNVNLSLNSGNFTYETVMSTNDTTYPIFGAGYGTAGTTIQSFITSSGALINLYGPIGALGQWVYGSYSNLNGYVSVTNQLRHIIVTNNGTTWQTYVDGQLVGNVTFYQPTTGTDVGIGRVAMQSPSNISTVVKMVKLYNRVLTSTEVLNNYNNIKRKYGI